MESLTVEFVFGFLELEVDGVVILMDGFEEIIPVERLVPRVWLRGGCCGFLGCGWSCFKDWLGGGFFGFCGSGFAFWDVLGGIWGIFVRSGVGRRFGFWGWFWGFW
jgi:hypothetical protein